MGLRIHNKERKTYVILGMLHSATSLISKALKDQGINMGKDLNKNLENQAFVSLNESILKNLGGTWSNPPSEENILGAEVGNQVKSAIGKNKEKFWGFKDPRTSLTIQHYLPYLGGDVYLICCFRKPDRIIKSFGGKYGVNKKLIDRYNRSIIKAIKEFCEL